LTEDGLRTRKDKKTQSKRFEKWREWEPGGTTGEQLGLLKGPGWSVCLGAGSEELDVEMRDGTTHLDATDPDAREFEEHLPARPDPWPGGDDNPLLSEIHGNRRCWCRWMAFVPHPKDGARTGGGGVVGGGRERRCS
jgi:hypothetical protein